MTSNKTLIKKNAFHSFKDTKSFEKWLQTKYHKHFLNGFKGYKGSLDCIAVSGILFTMEEYDMDGQSLIFGNKKKEKTMSIETSDRYKRGYRDAKVEIYPAFGFRNDINYIQ